MKLSDMTLRELVEYQSELAGTKVHLPEIPLLPPVPDYDKAYQRGFEEGRRAGMREQADMIQEARR